MQCQHPPQHLPGHVSPYLQARAPCLVYMAQAFHNIVPSLLPVICFLYIAETMPCCSSCGLPVQGHQVPTGPRCSILFDEAMHASGRDPECTVCQLPWSSHPRGKEIPKIASSAVSRCRVNPGRTSWNSRKMGMSMPGCPTLP